MQIRQASVIFLSLFLTVVLCHNTTVLSQCLVMLTQYARIIALDKGAVYRCSCGVNGCMGRKIAFEETASHKIKFFQAIFAPPSRWRPGMSQKFYTTQECRNCCHYSWVFIFSLLLFQSFIAVRFALISFHPALPIASSWFSSNNEVLRG